MKTNATSSDDTRRLESLISQLLKQRPELTRGTVDGLIQEKRNKVGGGYLTDQGALFLVASDLGVALTYNHVASTKLTDLAPETNGLTVVGRILSFGPPKSFTRKTDSKQGMLARMVIYDDSSAVPVNLWDNKASIVISGVKPGDLIKISNGYARKGIDGSTVLNLAEKGELQKIADQDSEIFMIDNRAVPPELVIEPAKFLVVRGKIQGKPLQSSFTRNDGTTGKLLSLAITSTNVGEEDSRRDLRVVIWDNTNPCFQSLKDGEMVTLLNVRARQGRRLESTDSSIEGSALELHGDESTCILEYTEETLHWIKKSSEGLFGISNVGSEGSQETVSKKSPTNKPMDQIPFIARVLSIGEISSDGNSIRMLLVDSQKRKLSVTGAKEAVEDATSLNLDDVVVCKPDSVDYLGLKAICSKKGSIVKTNAKREDIQKSSALITKIEKLEDPAIVSLRVMSLAESASKEVQTKDGLVRRSELQVGDETGEVRLFAWRDLSKMIDRIPAGEHLWLGCVEVQSHEGRKFLNLKNYSRILRDQQ